MTVYCTWIIFLINTLFTRQNRTKNKLWVSKPIRRHIYSECKRKCKCKWISAVVCFKKSERQDSRPPSIVFCMQKSWNSTHNTDLGMSFSNSNVKYLICFLSTFLQFFYTIFILSQCQSLPHRQCVTSCTLYSIKFSWAKKNMKQSFWNGSKMCHFDQIKNVWWPFTDWVRKLLISKLSLWQESLQNNILCLWSGYWNRQIHYVSKNSSWKMYWCTNTLQEKQQH